MIWKDYIALMMIWKDYIALVGDALRGCQKFTTSPDIFGYPYDFNSKALNPLLEML